MFAQVEIETFVLKQLPQKEVECIKKSINYIVGFMADRYHVVDARFGFVDHMKHQLQSFLPTVKTVNPLYDRNNKLSLILLQLLL